jgi:hypothetical protein
VAGAQSWLKVRALMLGEALGTRLLQQAVAADSDAASRTLFDRSSSIPSNLSFFQVESADGDGNK